MNDLADVISMLDFVLNSRRKRHIVGGILISLSALFGGLAVTVMTIHKDMEDEGNEDCD